MLKKSFYFLVVSLGSALLPIVCLGESFTIEQVLSAPFPYGLTSASHAPRVAWVFDNKGERNIWVADAPDFVPRRVTHYTGDDGQAIASVKLTPDGKTIVYARGSETNKEDTSANPQSLTKMPKQQAWAINVSGGEPRLLGDVGCNEEGCEDLQVSPDGKNVVWSAKKHLWMAPIDGKKKAEQLDELAGKSDTPRSSWRRRRSPISRRPRIVMPVQFGHPTANRSRLSDSTAANSNGRSFLSSRDHGRSLSQTRRAAKAASFFTAAMRWKIRCRCLPLNH